MSENELFNRLEKIYTNPKESCSFGGLNGLYARAKELKINGVTRKNVKKFLHSLPTYQKYRRNIWNFSRRSYVSFGIDDLYQSDTGFMLSLKNFNKKYSYFLIVVCVLSGMIFVEPLKTKQSKETADAFQKILTKSKRKIKRLMTDYGTEFTGWQFQEVMNNNNIKHILTSSPKKAGVAERGIRSVKNRLFRLLDYKKSWNWIDNIQNIVDGLNKNVNRITKFAPENVTNLNAYEVYKNRYLSKNKKRKPFSYKIGNYVRIVRSKRAFSRGFLPSYSNEIYKIDAVFNTIPNTYSVVHPKNDTYSIRNLYSPELVLVVNPDLEAKNFPDPPQLKRAI